MQLTGTEDLRVQKTIEGISRTFDEMILEMDYSQLTIKELCERAKINKKTFYRYYTCMDDLLEEKQGMIITECLQNISVYKVPKDLEALLRVQFQFFNSRDGLYGRIMSCLDGENISFERMCQITKKQYWDAALEECGCTPESKEMLVRFIHTNSIAFYSDWLRGGKQESMEELLKTAVSLICGGVCGFLQTVNGD